jgi:hypothetical protein
VKRWMQGTTHRLWRAITVAWALTAVFTGIVAAVLFAQHRHSAAMNALADCAYAFAVALIGVVVVTWSRN